MPAHAVLLGDPSFFRIQSGKNPYTRDRWGMKKKVDLPKATGQWNRFKDVLEGLGLKVFVLPPDEGNPSMVFPANAGFLHPKYEAIPWPGKKFYLSSLTAHRSGEQKTYRAFFESRGLPVENFTFSFEGEADFFPAGEFYLFCYGRIVPTGFRPAVAWPPYRYRFSHRSDFRNRQRLAGIVAPSPLLDVHLTDTRYYHGDTALFSFGKKREYLYVYPGAFDRETRERLKKHFGDKLFEMSKADAENFAANSFQADTSNGPHLLIPTGVSGEFKRVVARLGFPCTPVDVSEFFTKGGGSIKCLLCDLGPLC
jgi:N-dimethylarginine dimethylaminohydrolase